MKGTLKYCRLLKLKCNWRDSPSEKANYLTEYIAALWDSSLLYNKSWLRYIDVGFVCLKLLVIWYSTKTSQKNYGVGEET